MPANEKATSESHGADKPLLKILQPLDVAAIDEALGQIGLYGEVHLVVENGRLRYIRTVRSEPVAGTPLVKSGKTR